MPVQVTRASFEAVVSAQEELRSLLDRLIAENRPLKDDVERKDFFKLLAFSTIGLGTNQTTYLYNEDMTLLRRNIEVVARWAAYLTDPMVEAPMEIGKPKKHLMMDISRIWLCVRDELLYTFPYALERSWGQSQELKNIGRSQGHHIGKAAAEAL
jgi:hypothetical protein